MNASLWEFEPSGEGRFSGSFEPTWNQGPGTFGGLLAATLGSALERSVPGRPLRVLSLQICAPAVPGPLEAIVHIERKGALVTYASVRLEQDGKPVVLGTAVLGRGRTEDLDYSPRPPDMSIPPDGLPDLGGSPGAPAFAHNFDFRFVEGVPFSGVDTARSGGWLRTRRETPELSTPFALALLDTWPLAVLATMPRMRPAASISIQFQLFHPLPTAPETGWFRAITESSVCRQGYSDQVNQIWTPEGQLVGRSHQLVAVIR